jgi:cell pole-organizing protein PopZ
MNQPAKAKEPSMEEILASIRRIIADEDASKAPRKNTDSPALPPLNGPQRASVSAPPPRTPPISDPMNERNEGTLGEIDPPRPAGVALNGRAPSLDLDAPLPGAAGSRAENGRKTEAKPDAAMRNGADHPAAAGRGLLSPSTSAAVDSAFNTLAETVLVHNARTLEDMVKEMLRPMLKAWLDDNLPGLVERLVRAEIERVSRGR